MRRNAPGRKVPHSIDCKQLGEPLVLLFQQFDNRDNLPQVGDGRLFDGHAAALGTPGPEPNAR